MTDGGSVLTSTNASCTQQAKQAKTSGTASLPEPSKSKHKYSVTKSPKTIGGTVNDWQNLSRKLWSPIRSRDLAPLATFLKERTTARFSRCLSCNKTAVASTDPISLDRKCFGAAAASQGCTNVVRRSRIGSGD